MSIAILIIIGLLSAIIGSIVGIGGGIIIVPTLIYFGITQGILHDITPQTAIGTSSIILIATGLSSTLGYLKVKQVDVRNGFIFLIGILPGAFIGANLSRFLTIHSFNLYFGLFLILVSILLMIRYKIPPLKICQKPKYMKTYIDGHGEHFEYGVAPIIAVIAAFIIGLTSGLFGIGGGVLMTPLLLIVFRFPPHVAVGTSMMMVFFSSIAGSIGHVIQDHVVWSYSVILILSSYIGAQIGVKVNKAIKSDMVVLILRIVMLLLGFYLILQSFIG
ncbi:sulfite exporter TauE/SafE family protein [Staphylococcus hyicus]|uniref:sulfite exporter TauE/SafE family protein n=1 Tax=Staphylococcus hyicus TaxID=1284 RepID=UPI00208E3B95|nr:sulfite exporter TauE/SafE family protein [Staphylococcus hyicus]MCO4328464.1 sulfite exporter TauE/SafE family protein [Staphylococcus hyicus]MCO4330975.1 sulfite exporter TauE/SafE family protein [Staphylococcus hyicus]MCO4334640.1 sulfite exporter TauE/SafE family protein [Staphylococcus hyicus]MCO4335593.1 sulfite exporter TauE/SafE family protein [Staphylococcus hyicus]